MKILYIINGLATGGAEKLTIEIIPLLIKKGINVDVLLFDGTETNFFDLLKEEKLCNIYVIGNSIYNPLNIFKIIPYLKKYDLIHVNLFPAQYFTVFAKILSFSKSKLVFTEHSTSNRRLEQPKLKFFEKFIYNFYSKIICISPEVKSVLIDKLDLEKSKLTVVQNGVDIQKINNVSAYNRRDFGYINSNDILLIMVAGFRVEKDQDTVIKALKYLPSNYKLLLVGDGVRRTELEKLVFELNLNEQVNFLGIRTDVCSLIKMCDIAVLSSHWEGFGLSAVESMACGIPVIASKVKGLDQVVKNGGILFEAGKEHDLVDKIIKLNSQEYYKEITKSCLEKSKKYCLTNTINALSKVYNEI